MEYRKIPDHLKPRFEWFVDMVAQNRKTKPSKSKVIEVIKTTPSRQSAARVLGVSNSWLNYYCRENAIIPNEIREIESSKFISKGV